MSHLVFEDDADRQDKKEGDSERFLKGLRRTLEERRSRIIESKNGEGSDFALPLLVVIIDLMCPLKAGSRLNGLETDPAISMILAEGEMLGASLIVLSQNQNVIPNTSRGLLVLDRCHRNGNLVTEFRFWTVGINGARGIGQADLIEDIDDAEQFARDLEHLNVRRPYGSDLPMSVDMMKMLSINNETDMRQQITENWGRSIEPRGAEWLHAIFGFLSGGDPRELIFSAKEDGVHMMVAGSTGSGKSELLMTLILSLALRYDPQIVNFVLIDFKGGQTFDPFRQLPHVVDIVTNLKGNAVERMFASIRAELNRRQALNVTSDSKHIVHYRERNLHQVPYGTERVIKGKAYETAPYAHLFVIIDEFAEMIAESPEYKAELDSIARLGRSLGVTLILAAQRPSGVTDQMRANIKLKVSLRVETREESSELLRRPDAAYLPTGIPGRGLIMIGNEIPEMIQVAYSGFELADETVQRDPSIIWLSREASETDEPQERPKAFEVMVEVMANIATELTLPQHKPWPDFLPEVFSIQEPINTTYFRPRSLRQIGLDNTETERADRPDSPLSYTLSGWLNEQSQWTPNLWDDENLMRPVIGLIDNPESAEQLPLTLNLRNGHAALFGASGWGKTTFLRTVMTTLVTSYSPELVNIYILDFGGRNLTRFEKLPHVGGVITPDEEERIHRLLRMLNRMLDHRKLLVSEAGERDIYDFNRAKPEEAQPAILITIDNFAEFRESYESLLPNLISLARESRAYGIHFVLTAEQPGAINNKLYGLITERLTLKLSDASDYIGVIGRSVKDIEEVPGRGYVAMERKALQFQIALPTGTQIQQYRDEAVLQRDLIQIMDEEWTGIRPEPVATLPLHSPLKNLIDQSPLDHFAPIIALDDIDLSGWPLEMSRLGPHGFVIGPPGSGKTTLLRSILLSLASTYSAQEIQVHLIDFQGRFFNYGGKRSLKELPHVGCAVDRIEGMPELLSDLEQTASFLSNTRRKKKRAVFVLIDNYESFVEEIDEAEGIRGKTLPTLAKLARDIGTFGLHFLIAGDEGIARSNEPLRKRVQSARFGIVLQSPEAVQILGARVPRVSDELPPGRGYSVRAGRTALLQIGTPYRVNREIEQDLDRWVDEISEG